MALEIANKAYTYKVTKQPGLTVNASEHLLDLNKERLTTNAETKFWANYLHDLESIWWIIAWTSLNFEKIEDISAVPQYERVEDKVRDEIIDEIFPDDLHSRERSKFFHSESSFNTQMGMVPRPLLALEYIMEKLRKILNDAYLEEEYSLEKNDQPIELLHERVPHEKILEILKLFPDEDVGVVSIDDNPERFARMEQRLQSLKSGSDESKRPQKRTRRVFSKVFRVIWANILLLGLYKTRKKNKKKWYPNRS